MREKKLLGQPEAFAGHLFPREVNYGTRIEFDEDCGAARA